MRVRQRKLKRKKNMSTNVIMQSHKKCDATTSLVFEGIWRTRTKMFVQVRILWLPSFKPFWYAFGSNFKWTRSHLSINMHFFLKNCSGIVKKSAWKLPSAWIQWQPCFFTPVITVYSGKSSKTVLFRPFLSFFGVLFFPRNQSGEAIINNDTSA